MRVAGYEFSDGARFQPGASDNAGEVGAHLDHLRQHYKGELTPKDVVDDARNPNSPLHSFFDWNDTSAAEQHRLHQARGLIRSVVAIFVDDEKPAQRTKAFIHIPEPGAPHYRSAPDAMSSKKTREMVLQRAWRDWQAFRAKYKHLAEFAALFEAAGEVEKKLPKAARS